MDIWEYLGVKPTRDSKKLVQKVKEFDKVPKSKISWPMYGQTKKDGSYCLVVVKGNGSVGLFSRTGRMFTNVLEVTKHILSCSLPPAIYIAEICNDDCSLEEMNGLINPDRVNALEINQSLLAQRNYLAFHDVLPTISFIAGSCSIPYLDRYKGLRIIMVGLLCKPHVVLPLMHLENKEQADLLFDKAIKYEEEGIVYKPDVDWKAGHKGYRMMKRVRGVSYDLEVTGLIYGDRGTKRFGMVSNVLLKWKKGETLKADLGKGWTEEKRITLMRQPSRIVGKIVEVTALQESSKGKLRQPKVGQIRIDKFESDV